MKNCKDIALIVSLCKDIARHASQLEAECQGVEQSTERYFELKGLLLSYCLQGGDFKIICDEICKSVNNVEYRDNQGEITMSALRHMTCMLKYFMMLIDEMNKEDD